MSGIFWHIFVFSAIFLFLILMAYRILAITRLPVHLRWELAPIPHEKGRGRYGGSYLEEYEWWRKPRRRSRLAPVVYMVGEIFLLKGIWKNNRTLWPFSFSLHAGIYLLVFTAILSIINALFIITGVSGSILNVFQNITSIVAVAGYLLGSLGTIGLIFKRAIDVNLRLFSSFSTYFRLVLLGTVFVSGCFAWFYTGDLASGLGLFVKRLFTLNAGISATLPLATHIILSLLFIIYLPLTDMAHFITKYFTYHAVRWNDAPKNEKMVQELEGLLDQPVSWSAAHVKADGRKNWVELTAKKTDDDKEA